MALLGLRNLARTSFPRAAGGLQYPEEDPVSMLCSAHRTG